VGSEAYEVDAVDASPSNFLVAIFLCPPVPKVPYTLYFVSRSVIYTLCSVKTCIVWCIHVYNALLGPGDINCGQKGAGVY